MKKIVDWNDKEKLKQVIKKSITQIDVIKKLGLSHTSSGNYQTLLKYIKIYNIDISHFEGKQVAYVKLKNTQNKIHLSNDDFFSINTHRKTASSKKRILKFNLKENKCEECGLPPIWNGKKLVLQLDHINQITTDNRLENLRFLCPNCHTQTSTYGRSKQKSLIKEFNVEIFQKYREMPSKESIIEKIKINGRKKTKKELNMSHKMFTLLCKHYEINLDEIYQQNVKKIMWPHKTIIQKEILEKPLIQVCKNYNCTDNAVRRFIVKHQLFLPNSFLKGYWNKIQANKFPPITIDDLYLDENGAYQLKPEKLNIYQMQK